MTVGSVSAGDGVEGVLVCPVCRGALRGLGEAWHCVNAACGRRYEARDGVPRLVPEDGPENESDYFAGERTKWNAKRAAWLTDAARGVAPLPEAEILKRNLLRQAYLHVCGVGGTVLDVGCGMGHSSLTLARMFARVYAVDIAETGLAVLARAVAAGNGGGRVIPVVADAERLPFADGAFDAIFGKAVLHHLRLERAIPELARVLKPGGRAAFCEPLGHNPLVNLFRYVEHHWVHAYPGTDRPLRYGDARLFRQHFAKVEFVATSFLKDGVPALRPLERALLRVPPLRPLAAYMTVLLEKRAG